MKNIKNVFLIMIITVISLFVFNIDAEARNFNDDDFICEYTLDGSGTFDVYYDKSGSYLYDYQILWYPLAGEEATSYLYVYKEDTAGSIEEEFDNGTKFLIINQSFNPSATFKFVDDTARDIFHPTNNVTCPKMYYKRQSEKTYVYFTNYEALDLTGVNDVETSEKEKQKENSTDNPIDFNLTCSDGTVNSKFWQSMTSFKSTANTHFDNTMNTVDTTNLTMENIEYIMDDMENFFGDEKDGKVSEILTSIEKSAQTENACKVTDKQSEYISEKYDEETKKWLEDKKSYLEGLIDEGVANGTITQETAQQMKEKVDGSIENIETTISNVIVGFEKWTGMQSGEKIKDQTCEAIFDQELVDQINEIFTWLRIGVPILLIMLGVMDFSKAVLFEDGSSNGELNKAVKIFIKRCIIAVAIFFVPTIINLLVTIFNSVSDIPLTAPSSCGIN